MQMRRRLVPSRKSRVRGLERLWEHSGRERCLSMCLDIEREDINKGEEGKSEVNGGGDLAGIVFRFWA